MTKAEQLRVTAWRLQILRWAQDEPRQVAETRRTLRRMPAQELHAAILRELGVEQYGG